MTDSFFHMKNKAAEIGRSDPSGESIIELVSCLEDSDVAREFWHGLESSAWIVPLKERELFSTQDDSGADPWPPSVYLNRIAGHEPQIVADIFCQIDTVNPYLICDMLEASLKMPADVVKPLAEHIAGLLDKGANLSLRADKFLQELVNQLSEHSSNNQLVFDLVRARLSPQVETDPQNRRQAGYSTIKAVEGFMPVVIKIAPQKTIDLLCKLLTKAVQEKGGSSEGSPTEDFSYMWRPAIEDHPQNSNYDLAGKLVDPLRNAAEQVVRTSKMSIKEVLETLRSHKYLIFHRLSVHVINVFAEQDRQLARNTMKDTGKYDTLGFRYEYAMLLGKRFNLLLKDEKTKFFGWIDRGPTAEDHQDRVREWKYVRLLWIRDHLKGRPEEEFFNEMRADYGDPEFADMNVRSGVRFGAESPVKVEELLGLSLEEVLGKLLAWRLTDQSQFLDPLEGMQTVFGTYVRQRVESCAIDAKLMRDRPSMFVRPFISAMKDAVNEGKTIALEPTLDLCLWVVRQPADVDTRPFPPKQDGLVDRNWRWCRQQAGDFVEKCCEKAVEYSNARRKAFWLIVEPLTHDGDEPNIDHPQEDDIRSRAYISHSLNSPRGSAMHAMFAFARWVANEVKQGPKGSETIPDGFESIREVRVALDKGLKAGEYESLAIRAAFGWHFGLLYWIDKEWLKSRIDQLCDLEGDLKDPATAQSWAFWNAFLVCTVPYKVYFELLQKQFMSAVLQYRTLDIDDVSHNTPAGRLGEHLVVLYGRGQLALEDNDGLLRSFLSKSCQPVRSYAISFVGRSLFREEGDSDEPLPEEVLDRFKELWDWYWPEVEVGRDDEEPSKDLFGYWYMCKRFDPEWAMQKLADYMQRVPSPDHYFGFFERLAEDANHNPQLSLSILEKLINAGNDDLRDRTHEQEIHIILGACMQADEATKSKAVELINNLGRKGLSGLGELLDE